MTAKPARIRCTDLLGVSSEEYQRLLAAARAPEAPCRKGTSERDERVELADAETLIAAFQPGEGYDLLSYRVRPVNVSATGMAFLHGAFVYPGTPCSVLARDAEGGYRQLSGHVVRCRLIQGRVHEVGMRFDAPIEVDRLAVRTPAA